MRLCLKNANVVLSANGRIGISFELDRVWIYAILWWDHFGRWVILDWNAVMYYRSGFSFLAFQYFPSKLIIIIIKIVYYMHFLCVNQNLMKKLKWFESKMIKRDCVTSIVFIDANAAIQMCPDCIVSNTRRFQTVDIRLSIY